MPRLRFTRDERGYEHTFLVHSTGRRGRERTSILYWFRSPPAVRVGRPALDSDAIRAIEKANPQIVFDWPVILETRPPEPEPAEGWRARRGRGRDRAMRPDSGRQDAASAATVPHISTPDPPETARLDRPVSATPPVPETDPSALADRDPVFEPSAVHRALGSEGLARVRARYAEVIARISTQVSDGAVADELRLLAERLNPDAWVTDDDVLRGLEGFERVLEHVRQSLGRSRRRRGDSPPEPAGTSASTAGGVSTGETGPQAPGTQPD